MVQTCFICKWRANREPRRSFHKFPSEESEKNKWLSIIGKGDVNVGKRISVCSIHFEDSCFRYGTVYGTKILKMNSVPTLHLTKNIEKDDPTPNKYNNVDEETALHTPTVNEVKVLDSNPYTVSSNTGNMNLVQKSEETKFLSLQWTPDEHQVSCTVEPDASEELDAPASMKVCRVCLACDIKMYHIGDYKLSEYLQQITGILLSQDDRLPKMLCWECVGRLMSAKRFRDKALRSQNLLSKKINVKTYINMRDVKSINRIRNKLQSTLTMKHFETNDSDLTVHIAEDIKSETGVGYDEDDYSDDKDEIIPEVVLQVKHEDLFEDCPGNGTDDEVFKDVKKKSKVKYKKVVKDSSSITTRRKLKEEPSVSPRKRSADSLSSPACSKRRIQRTSRYKKTVGSRPALVGGLDESLFTVTALTQAEQIAEVQRRRESHAYATARYKCTVCYKVFHTQATHDAHSLKHSDRVGSFECPICKIRLKTTRVLRKHLTAMHTRKYTCNKCPFTTKDRSVARRHEIYHTGVKYQCPHCPKQFDKQTTYFGHIRLKHVSRFVCELCGYTFINQKGIELHKFKKHKMVDKNVELLGPYCADCDVRFVSQDAYARHLQLSAQHRPDGEPERVTNNSQTAERKGERHRGRRTSGDRQLGLVSCEQCGEECADYRAYAQHFLRAHPGHNRTLYPARAPCMCDQCGKIFQSSVQLKGHMWVHTGDKPFKCDRCDKSFSNKPGLQLHRKSHSGTRPTFPCPICDKHFTSYSNMRRHMLIHTGQKPFSCDTCGKCFLTSAERRSHVDHVHLKVPWPKRTREPRTKAWS